MFYKKLIIIIFIITIFIFIGPKELQLYFSAPLSFGIIIYIITRILGFILRRKEEKPQEIMSNHTACENQKELENAG